MRSHRSGTSIALAAALVVCLVACERVEPADPVAEAAWQAYNDAPSIQAYMQFVRENGKAAARHASPDDAVGVQYQVRALEVQAWQCERDGDAERAVLVVSRVDELEDLDSLDLYEEALPGSRERFLAARSRAAAVLDQK